MATTILLLLLSQKAGTHLNLLSYGGWQAELIWLAGWLHGVLCRHDRHVQQLKQTHQAPAGAQVVFTILQQEITKFADT